MVAGCAGQLLCAVSLLLMLPVCDAAEWIYVVRPGDNPWSITERYLAGIRYWPQLQQYNDIHDPTHIAPGTRLRIPLAWLRREREPARVIALNGEVSLTRPNQPVLPLELDTAVEVGDVLRTAPDGSIELSFADGSRIYLRGDSELRLLRSDRIPQTDEVNTRVQLPRGRSESRVRGVGGNGGRFEIDTPAAVTSVRGTHFRVNAAAARAWTEVLEGGVRVANNAARVELGPRMGTVTVAGRAPAAPTRLLAPPDLSSVPAELERVPFTFSIPPLPGAARYRLQIAASPDFATLLDDAEFDTPALRGPALADGAYHLRVRGIDAQQLEGLDAVRSITVNAQPEPPFLSEPPPEAQLADGVRYVSLDPCDRSRHGIPLSVERRWGLPAIAAGRRSDRRRGAPSVRRAAAGALLLARGCDRSGRRARSVLRSAGPARAATWSCAGGTQRVRRRDRIPVAG